MNFKLVLKVLGRILQIEAAMLIFPMLVAAFHGEDTLPFLYSIAIVALTGVGLLALPAKKGFFARDGFVSVGLIWIATCALGALPFWFSGQFASFTDCLFESCSGFTTTGATTLTDIEAMPRGILFWRSFTQWLGGMGVLVLATAVFPSMGIRSHYLTQAETPGPVFTKLVPKQSQTSKILYTIYCSLTALEALCLKLAGMPLYDAVIHAFSSAGTGGFSNRNASVGAYGSAAIDLIITLFMLLFSLNFAVYFLLVIRKFKEVLTSDELRFFLFVVCLGTGLIALDIFPLYGSLAASLRHAAFQVAAVVSTTGFATADYVMWPQFAQMIIVFLMFLGGCAGSTAGGIKSSRILLLLRSFRREIHHILHPRSVEVVTLDGKVVGEDTLRSVMVFVSSYLIVVLLASLTISLDDFSFSVSFSSALACVSNIGPGLEIVGPMGNFSAFSHLSKLVMSFCMIIGRLELFPIFVLFSSTAWRRT